MSFTLHWLCQQPTPYNDVLFNALAADPAVNLNVHYMDRLRATHPWQGALAQAYPARYYERRLGLDWQLIRFALRDRESMFLIGGWHEPTIQTLINLLSIRGQSFVLWTDTPDIERRRHPLKAFLRANWLKWVFSRAFRVLGTGKPALEALAAMGCPPQKLINLPYFVDLEVYKPAAARNHASGEAAQMTFLAVGRLETRKGYDLALRAFAQVAAKMPEQPFCVRIAGVGSEAGHLEQLVHQLGLAEQVEFVGWLEAQELPAFLQMGDVFVHPARNEPYGVAVLEAMACGLPVIGSDVTGAVLDRIQHKRNGLIHDTDDVDSLAEQIEFLLSHPAERIQLGKRARQTAEEWPLARGVETITSLFKQSKKG